MTVVCRTTISVCLEKNEKEHVIMDFGYAFYVNGKKGMRQVSPVEFRRIVFSEFSDRKQKAAERLYKYMLQVACLHNSPDVVQRDQKGSFVDVQFSGVSRKLYFQYIHKMNICKVIF